VPARLALEPFAGIGVLPGFDLLVRVLDHDDGRIDHGANGDGDAAERHDVGIDTLVVHDDERHQHAERQGQDGDERAAQVDEKHQADKRHDDEFLDEFFGEVPDRALDEPRAVIGLDHFDPRRQARLERRHLGFHRGDGLERVLAVAHDHDAARHLAFAAELGDAPAHLGT
jgi:hypothetical protein